MDKKGTIKYFVVFLTILSVVAGVLGWVVLHYFIPAHYFPLYPVIPVYFFLFGLLYIYLFDKFRTKTQQSVVLFYSSIRMMKLMVSIVGLILYGVLVKTQIKELLFTFIVFYLIYLLFETLFFFNFERNLKKQKVKLKNEAHI